MFKEEGIEREIQEIEMENISMPCKEKEIDYTFLLAAPTLDCKRDDSN